MDNVASIYGHSSIYRGYLRWDAENPHFYELFEQFTKQWLTRHSTASAALVFERIRWESGIRTTGESWTLNNNYRAIYARRFMIEHPEYGDCFRTRDSGRVKQAA